MKQVVNGDFRVGPWLVAPNQNSISCKGTTVRLEPKVMEVLVCLAEHAGETLPKETLFHTVWPDTFVTDDVLTHSISELRRAFEDDAREPHIIQTIPKRGYRLVAPVSTAVVVAAVSTTRDSIAVLPFVNMSADTENEYFTDGITEEIINALAQIEHLHVAARSSAFFFKGKYVDLQAIGERLKVRTILEGSVRRVGSHLRITAQLVNVADGYHLWSERYDREMKDVFEIQDEIARSIADRLKVTFTGNPQEPLVRAGTKNLEAYQLYLKGRALLFRKGSAIPRALECFERAVGLASDYAQAWAGVADSYTSLGYYGFARPEATMPKGMESARRSVALDPSLAEAHNALAMACLMGAWDKAEAEREFLRALELNPKYLQARGWYALFYLQFAGGRLLEGVAQAKLALESDPLSSYAHTIYSFTCAFAGKYAEAVQASRRAVELDSESYLAHVILAAVLYLSEQFEEAVAASESALAISGRHNWAMVALAESLAGCGKRAEAEATYSELICRARRYYVQPSSLAMAAAAVGIQDEAIRYAREAFQIRDPYSLVWFSKIWPPSARLREDPRSASSLWIWDGY